MKIKKFNESTSRQIEGLDGEIFKLKELTGKITSVSEDGAASGLHGFIHFESGAIGLELEYQEGQTNQCLDKEFELIRIDSKDVFYAENDFDYHVFVLKSIRPKYRAGESWSRENILARISSGSADFRFIGIFDSAGKLLLLTTAVRKNGRRGGFLSDEHLKMLFFDDILTIQNSESYFFQMNLKTKKYGSNYSTGFWKIMDEADKKN